VHIGEPFGQIFGLLCQRLAELAYGNAPEQLGFDKVYAGRTPRRSTSVDGLLTRSKQLRRLRAMLHSALPLLGLPGSGILGREHTRRGGRQARKPNIQGLRLNIFDPAVRA
jgi:hypothetical protein